MIPKPVAFQGQDPTSQPTHSVFDHGSKYHWPVALTALTFFCPVGFPVTVGILGGTESPEKAKAAGKPTMRGSAVGLSKQR